jgi:RNase P subunit RPR2
MIPLSLLRRIDRWLRDHRLVWCVRCQYLMFSKDARYRMSNTGIVAALCPECEKQLYHPFSKERQ